MGRAWPDGVHHHHLGRAVLRRGERLLGHLRQRRVVDVDARLAVVDGEGGLAVGEPVVDGAADRAELLGGEVEEGPLGAVVELVHHHVRLHHAAGAERVRQLVRHLAELGVGPAPAALDAGERGPLRVAVEVPRHAVEVGEVVLEGVLEHRGVVGEAAALGHVLAPLRRRRRTGSRRRAARRCEGGPIFDRRVGLSQEAPVGRPRSGGRRPHEPPGKRGDAPRPAGRISPGASAAMRASNDDGSDERETRSGVRPCWRGAARRARQLAARARRGRGLCRPSRRRRSARCSGTRPRSS